MPTTFYGRNAQDRVIRDTKGAPIDDVPNGSAITDVKPDVVGESAATLAQTSQTASEEA